MEIRLYFQMLQRGWWIILLVGIIAFAGSLGLSYIAVPQYEAVGRYIISPGGALTGRDVLSGLNTLDPSIVATYVEVMISRRIKSEALTEVGLNEAEALNYTIQAVELPDSSVIELTVSGPNPNTAAELANSIGNHTIDFARSLNTVFVMNVLDTAIRSEVPISPQPLRDAIVALVLGIMAGMVLAILREQIRIPLEAYRQRTRVDNVTGVYNSRYFTSLLEDELARHPDDLLSLGIVELTGLEDLIETLPPAALQIVLQKVTETLRKELRGHDLIGRLSENSFIVMLPATPGVAANRTFARICQALARPANLPQYGVTIDFAPYIGGAVYSSGISAPELLEKAKSSLEQARHGNGDHIYVWEIKNPFWAGSDVAEAS